MDAETVKTYSVTLPIAGTMYCEIRATSPDEAIAAAMDRQYNDEMDELEWEPMRVICEGNVLYAPTNEPEAEEID